MKDAANRNRIFAGLFAATLFLSLLPNAAQAAGVEFKFVALSDPHISSEADLVEWRKFLYTVQQQETPDMFLVTGDIVGHEPHMLSRVRWIADHSTAMVHVVAGNHDDDYGRCPEYFEAAFGSMYYAFDHKGWKIIMGWSQNPPLTWLQDTLSAMPVGTPVIYCAHYPAASDMGSYNILMNYATRVGFAGHTHAESSTTCNGIPVRVLGQCTLTSGPYYVYTARDETPFNFGMTRKYASSLTLLDPPDATPTISLTSPATGSTISGTVLFQGTAADNSGLSQVQYRIDRGVWQAASGLTSWSISVNTAALSEEHHFFEFRSIDNANQETLSYASGIYYVDNLPESADTLTFQQGIDAYAGCTGRTITNSDASRPSLECWTWSSGAEFNEFYLRFDLSGVSIPAGSDVTSAKVTVYLTRQNNQSLGGGTKPANYNVGIVGGPWSAGTTWATRPAPAWTAGNTTSPAPALTGAWPYFDFGYGTYPTPPEPIVIDLTPIKDTVQGWAETPSTNYGLVFSPKIDNNYNFTFAAPTDYGWCKTLRPKLELVISGGGGDTTAPTVTVSSAKLTGTVADNQACPTIVNVAGTPVTVTSTGLLTGTWISQDVSLPSASTTIVVQASDTSSNTRTVNVLVVK